MKAPQDAYWADMARAYFAEKKVYRYHLKKIIDMADDEVIRACHAWQEKNGMVKDYWAFVDAREQQ